MMEWRRQQRAGAQEPWEVHVSEATPAGQDSIRMTPEEEQAALESQATDEATDDPGYTEN
jgi:hypothetical protein